MAINNRASESNLMRYEPLWKRRGFFMGCGKRESGSSDEGANGIRY